MAFDIFKSYRDLTGKKSSPEKPKKDFFKAYRDLTGKIKPDIKKEEVKEEPKKEKITYADIRPKFKVSRFNFLAKLGIMIQKDLKLILRSKTSALIVLLGPLLIIFLVGMAFNTSSLYNLKIATYSEEYSTLTNEVISELEDQQYSIIKTDSPEKCIEGISLGNHHVCAIFPKAMTVDNAADNLIELYVDESRVNIASLISNTIIRKIGSKSTELSIGLTAVLVDTLETTKSEIDTKQSTIDLIISSNKEGINDIENIRSELGSLDITINETELNVSLIDNGIEDIEDMNLSGGVAGKLNDIFSYFRDSLDLLDKKFKKVNETRETTLTTLDTVQGIIRTGNDDVRAIKSSLNKISSNIQGIAVKDVESIVSPIKTDIKPITSKTTHLSFLFPTLVVLVVMFISVLFAATLVIREKTSPSYFRNFITPTNDILFMFGIYLTNILLVLIQLAILFAVALYFFKGELVNVLLNAVLALIIICTVFILIGMFIGYLFKTEETATLGAIAVSAVMLFFSNTILPIESLPNLFGKIAQYNPFVIGESIIKKIILFSSSLQVVGLSIYVLLGFIALFFALGFVAMQITKRDVI